jgi:hypothetical protein
MKLVELAGDRVKAIWDEHFGFAIPSNVEYKIHQIRIDGQTIGYVATELHGKVACPHVKIFEGFRNKAYLTRVTWLFENVYKPMLKEVGFEFLVTNCAVHDVGTTNFMKKLGFNMSTIVVGEIKL